MGACAQTTEHAGAIALFEQSVDHYRAGRFERAAELLREAYALEPEPVLLYNLARALEGAGEDDAAADAYRRYLASEETPADAAAARARLEVLDTRIGERRALEERAREAEASARARQVAQTQPEPAPPARQIDPAPWIVAGAGALALGVGGVLGGLMLDRSQTAQSAPIHRDAVGAQADAEALAIGADVSFGVGALLMGVGLVWGIVDLTREASPLEAQLRLGPLSAALVGSFE